MCAVLPVNFCETIAYACKGAEIDKINDELVKL